MIHKNALHYLIRTFQKPFETLSVLSAWNLGAICEISTPTSNKRPESLVKWLFSKLLKLLVPENKNSFCSQISYSF